MVVYLVHTPNIEASQNKVLKDIQRAKITARHFQVFQWPMYCIVRNDLFCIVITGSYCYYNLYILDTYIRIFDSMKRLDSKHQNFPHTYTKHPHIRCRCEPSKVDWFRCHPFDGKFPFRSLMINKITIGSLKGVTKDW